MKRHGTQVLENNEVVLRAFTLADAESFYENVMSDINVFKYFAFNAHTDIAETKKCINDWITVYESPNTYIWAIIEKESQMVIGTIHLDSMYIELLNTGELSYYIGSKWWGKGYATQAVRIGGS